ncbi:DUF7262 family protein [Haloarchaeobius litoreus]|uniref:Uncharacterized protein n=1 Tax=Haloarchaeobius litoreus TaxID=755306 RepID=A0ABD6DDL5_9EURY|nr:hypothetical protein [Haloarchaeobius litoreus]
MTERAQLSLPAVEAAIGVLLVLAVVATFALPVADGDTTEAQLDTYASDAATVLSGEPPRHGGATRLSEVARSEASFEREQQALERRVERILPHNLLYRVETPHGSVGYRVPAGVSVGVATVPTGHGEVTIRVWYV